MNTTPILNQQIMIDILMKSNIYYMERRAKETEMISYDKSLRRVFKIGSSPAEALYGELGHVFK